MPHVTAIRPTIRTAIGAADNAATATAPRGNSATLPPAPGHGSVSPERGLASLEARVFRTSFLGLNGPRGWEMQALRIHAHRRLREWHRLPVLPLVRAW